MKRLVAPALTVVVLVAAAIAVLTYLSGEAPRAALTLAEVQGDVTVTGRDGEPTVVGTGAVLSPLDRVATGSSSRAVLSLGEETRIRLAPESSVQVRGQDDEGVTLELEGGALQATVRPGAGALRVGSRGRQVLSTDGAFEMGLGDDGTLVVEMTEGHAVTSGFEGVPPQLSSGDRATVGADGAATIAPIPEELLLAVEWPTERRIREDQTVVSGTTQAGSRVRIEAGDAQVVVLADAAGRFTAAVPLADGRHRLRVEAVDPLGNVALVDMDGDIEVDTRGPTFRGGVEYGKPGSGP